MGKWPPAPTVAVLTVDEGAVADLEDAQVDVAGEGVVDSTEDGVVELADFDGGVGGFGGAGADGCLDVGLEGAVEGLAGDADADEEIAQQGVVGMQVGVAHVEAGVELAGVEEVVVSAEVVASRRRWRWSSGRGRRRGLCLHMELLTRMAMGLK